MKRRDDSENKETDKSKAIIFTFIMIKRICHEIVTLEFQAKMKNYKRK